MSGSSSGCTPNACGGCGALTAEPGAPCGACGTYHCLANDLDVVECSAPRAIQVTATFNQLQALHGACTAAVPESLACFAAMRRYCYALEGCANRTPVAWGPTAVVQGSVTFNCVEGFIHPLSAAEAPPFVSCQAQVRSAACAALAHEVCKNHGGTGLDVQEFAVDGDGRGQGSVGCVNPPVLLMTFTATGLASCSGPQVYGPGCFAAMQEVCHQAGFAGTAGPLEQSTTSNTTAQMACFN